MLNHLSNHHPELMENTPSTCSYCGLLFKTASKRQKHEYTHNRERKYKCTYCQKVFVTSAQRQRHERCHTGEKPYQVNSYPPLILKLFL